MKHRGVIILHHRPDSGPRARLAGVPEMLYEHIEQPLQFSHKVHTGETAGLPCDSAILSRGWVVHRNSPAGEMRGVSFAGSWNSPRKKLVDEYVTPATK